MVDASVADVPVIGITGTGGIGKTRLAQRFARDWLGTLRYRGFPVVKDSANQVIVGVGAAYVDFRQFYLGAPQAVSLIDEKPMIAGQKRVVILAAQGSPDVPAAAVVRDVTVEVPDTGNYEMEVVTEGEASAWSRDVSSSEHAPSGGSSARATSSLPVPVSP